MAIACRVNPIACRKEHGDVREMLQSGSRSDEWGIHPMIDHEPVFGRADSRTAKREERMSDIRAASQPRKAAPREVRPTNGAAKRKRPARVSR